ncbi:hypothetical protein C2E23DRAFT_887353 [Lenzites betulinus]|nr:hypothetical protein C2E23DRAFT_887353 [Lenzites betulinus]
MSEAIRSSTSAVKSPSDLPPPRDRQGIRPVSPPFSHTPLYRFNYYIALLAAGAFAFYAWRLLQWKADVGGWWNLALGRRPPGADAVIAGAVGAVTGGPSQPGTVESRINELAAALGMPSRDLAIAIAGAVRQHVPPASLSSVAANEPSGTAVQYLVNPSAAAAAAVNAKEAGAHVGSGAVTGGAEAIANAFEAVLGMDEPPNEIGSSV